MTSKRQQNRVMNATELARLMRQLQHGHNLFDIFRDFVEMSAIAVSNSVDLRQRDEREKRYLDIIGRYSKSDQQLFPRMLACLVNELEDKPSDVLGKLFGELDLGSDARGQFFTPYEVCQLMADMTIGDPAHLRATVERQGFATVMEPACGAGAMLIAFTESARKHGINPQRHLHITAQDVDQRAVHMTYLQLSLLHIPATIMLGNTLALECREIWNTPAHILNGWTWRLKTKDSGAEIPVSETRSDSFVSDPPPASPPTPANDNRQLALFAE